jgi:hypothetical protein
VDNLWTEFPAAAGQSYKPASPKAGGGHWGNPEIRQEATVIHKDLLLIKLAILAKVVRPSGRCRTIQTRPSAGRMHGPRGFPYVENGRVDNCTRGDNYVTLFASALIG